MKKALFIVNTPYQLMVVISMTKNEYKNCLCDVLVSDRLNQHRELVSRIRNANVFNTVIHIELNKLFPQNKKLKAIINSIKTWDELTINTYDYLLFANLNYDVSCLFKQIKKKNTNVKLFMFEDGFASYSDYYNEYINKFRCKSGSFVTKCFHYLVNSAFRYVDGIYLFDPELITYRTEFDIIRLKKIEADEQLLELYNNVFNYYDSKDDYSRSVIFFEESYFADGIETNDIDVINEIARYVGKDNIFIKIHPRNPQNRFKEMGYYTNSNTSIPWEVIAMNLELEGKILISIASAAVIVPSTMLGKNYKGILLYKTLENDSFIKKNITNLYDDICEKYANLYVVKDKKELMSIIGL